MEPRVSANTTRGAVDGAQRDPRGQINMRVPLDWPSSSRLISNVAQRYSHYQSILMIVFPPLGSMLVNSEEGICALGQWLATVRDSRCDSGAKAVKGFKTVLHCPTGPAGGDVQRCSSGIVRLQ